MKSIFRLYAKTSKGNDSQLLNELRSYNLQPRYDANLQSFYFNSNFHDLFNISFYSLSLQQLFVQIGQRFPLIEERQISQQLKKLPLKNYLRFHKDFLRSTTLKVLIRQSNNLPSQKVLTFLLSDSLRKEIIRKQYFHNVIGGVGMLSENLDKQTNAFIADDTPAMMKHLSLRQMQQIVERKWYDEQVQIENKINLLTQQIQSLQKQIAPIGDNSTTALLEKRREDGQQNDASGVIELQESSKSMNKSFEIQKIRKLKYQLSQYKKKIQPSQQQQKQAETQLIFYARRNKARILLKINREQLYKHGFKQCVNWGPLRQSLAAGIINRSKLLEKSKRSQQGQTTRKILRIWDPMCGSGTLGLVASTILQNVPVRANYQKLFLWPKWPVFKQSYLDEFWSNKMKDAQQISKKYQIVLSDNDLKTINYSITNFQKFEQHKKNLLPLIKQQRMQNKQKRYDSSQTEQQNDELLPLKSVTSQFFEISPKKIGCVLGDFQDVIKQLIPSSLNSKKSAEKSSKRESSTSPQKEGVLAKVDKKINPINIITNLPYLHERSSQKYQSKQLQSIYKRFNRMIQSHKDHIQNVFIIIDQQITDPNHFLRISTEKWNLLSKYSNGGIEVGLYGWSENKIGDIQFQDVIGEGATSTSTSLINVVPNVNQLSPKQRQLFLAKEKSITNALIKYRQKVKGLNRAYYRLPGHLIKTKKGWRRVKQKRRVRHLQAAYQIFAKRRDQMIAYKEYTNEKLQIKMLKRGSAWKSKNLKLFENNIEKLTSCAGQIKEEFQNIIKEANKRQQEWKQKIQQKKNIKNGYKVPPKNASSWNPPNVNTKNRDRSSNKKGQTFKATNNKNNKSQNKNKNQNQKVKSQRSRSSSIKSTRRRRN